MLVRGKYNWRVEYKLVDVLYSLITRQIGKCSSNYPFPYEMKRKRFKQVKNLQDLTQRPTDCRLFIAKRNGCVKPFKSLKFAVFNHKDKTQRFK